VTTENDETDQTIVNDPDDAIIRAIGEELRRARANAGWSRPQLVKYMKTQIPVNTYACYEQGIRQCSIPRLVEICQALGVSAPELIGLALQRLELDLDRSVVQIDLRKIVRDERRELRPLRRWARNRIKEDALAIEPHEPAVVRLQWSAVKEIATFCGISKVFLLRYIRDFTPESAAQTGRTADYGV
jgi:transcriptional regulator with XRE-family HTH domain